MRRNKSGTEHILLIDTEGGRTGTITSGAWKILEETNHRTTIQGYQSKESTKICKIVNGVTTVKTPGMDEPILFVINYATLIEDDSESESLCQPFNLMEN